MTFSERVGLRQPKVLVQSDSMDDDLRTGLWNALWLGLYDRLGIQEKYDFHERVWKSLWLGLWKRPVDNCPHIDAFWATLREVFLSGDWNEVYDVVDYVAGFGDDDAYVQEWVTATNFILEHERSAYRIVTGRVQRLTGPEEIAAVERALDDARHVSSAREHLSRAADLLADRKSPDYRNSIKESISAVEATCEALSGAKGSLGNCLKSLQSTANLHPALTAAFQKLYGYTSDAQGIRHALSEELTLDHADAIYMLVSCSAFVSYLVAKGASAAEQ